MSEHGHGPPSVEPGRVKVIVSTLFFVCAVTVVADFFYDKHTYYDFEHLPGFHALYGFVSCVLLVLAAAQMRKVVMRDEDYYDR